jgi:hypothetical protein
VWRITDFPKNQQFATHTPDEVFGNHNYSSELRHIETDGPTMAMIC